MTIVKMKTVGKAASITKHKSTCCADAIVLQDNAPINTKPDYKQSIHRNSNPLLPLRQATIIMQNT